MSKQEEGSRAARRGRGTGVAGVILLVGVLGLPVRGWGQQIWSPVPYGGDHCPNPRALASQAFDADRGVTVLFGGSTTTAPDAAHTWEYDGVSWKRVATTGPSVRYGAGMTFDSLRKRIVLHGGRDWTTGILSDTWEWNGIAWTPGASGGPAAHAGGLVFDRRRGQSVWVAGLTRHPSGYTAALPLFFGYDGATWAPLLPNYGATQREAPAVCYFDGPAAGAVTVFSGYRANTLAVWAWDSDTQAWTSFPPQAGVPQPSEGFSLPMAFDSHRQVAVYVKDRTTWTWDGATWANSGHVAPPTGGNTMSYDSARRKMVLFGSGLILGNSTWEYDATSGWRQVIPETIPGASSVSVAGNRATGEILLFDVSRVWAWTRDGWVLRYKHPTEIAVGNVVYHEGLGVYVGLDAQGTAWSWNGTAWATLPGGQFPLPRLSNYRMAYDRSRGVIVLFGGVIYGTSPFTYSTSVWEWNGTWTEIAAPNGPSARTAPALAYDDDAQTVVIYGGQSTSYTMLADTWQWDGTQWTQRAASGSTAPAPRYLAGLTYDRHRQGLVLFGGTGTGYVSLADTWVLRGASWERLSDRSPGVGARNAVSLVYDDSLRSVRLFGGSGTDATGVMDAWVMEATDTTPPVITAPEALTVNPTSPHGTPVTYQVTAIDDLDGAVTPVCQPSSGTTFPIATTEVVCTATDAAGNRAEARFPVTVRSVEAILTALIGSPVVAQLPPGPRQVEQALASLQAGRTTPACRQIAAFIHQVDAQVGKTVTTEEAASVREGAWAARAALGCR